MGCTGTKQIQSVSDTNVLPRIPATELLVVHPISGSAYRLFVRRELFVKSIALGPNLASKSAVALRCSVRA